MVGVVQPDAQDLVRPSDRRADSLVTEFLSFAGGDPLGHWSGEQRSTAAGGEPLVEVRDQIRDIDKVAVVDADNRPLLSGWADAHKKHEDSLVEAMGNPNPPPAVGVAADGAPGEALS